MSTPAFPKEVLVNGRTMQVKLRPPHKMGTAAGWFLSNQGLIEISKGQDADEQKDTLLHEVFHALLHTQGREYGGEEEELYVRALATGFIGLLKGDPEFIQWLVASPTDEREINE